MPRSFARTTTFLVSIAAVSAVISFHRPPVAFAGESGKVSIAIEGGSGSGSTDGENIEAEVRFDAPPASDGCVWETVSGIDPLTVETGNATTAKETLFYKACGNKIVGYQWIRTDAPTRVAQTAGNKVSRLVPSLLMRTAPPSDRMIVGVGTWFWIPRTAWKPLSVTAWIQTPGGPVSVTTTATPNNLIYSPGDGRAPVSCAGPGRAWSATLSDRATTNCMYVYKSASHTQAVRVYNTKMSIQWKVTWRSSLGIRGTLPSITTGLPMKVRVRELQALSR
jgi:hypothetical protein